MRFRRGRTPSYPPFRPLLAAIQNLESRVLLSSTAYSWQNVAIGAGGFVDGIFYSPTQPDVVYARTDIGGLYKSTDDGANWNQLLDFVGNSTGTSGNGTQQQEIGVLSFAIDPENPNNLYADVGEYSWANGAVFYSTDGGQTWGKTNLSFYVGGNSDGRGDGEQIAVDPNNSNIVFLGSNDHGLWESTDAGHSFSRISTSAFSPGSTTFVLFDPSSGTPGSASQTIYVGINSTSSGTNLYMTSNGGTSWSQVSGTGSLPSGYLPGRAVLSNGYLYLAYANAEAPNGSITNGGVYRYAPSTSVWANITPKSTSGHFGYVGIAADAQNPNTIVVTSFDYYSGPDQMWRTINANTSHPSWTEVFDYGAAQNFGYGGYNTTRDTSNAPWIAAFGDGIGNWAASVAINPFNSNQLMYGTGQGIWATNNLSNNGTNTQLTGANSWYFPDTGIEFTAVGGVATASQGVPLFSAMGDILGFAHTTLTSSPAQGAAQYFGSGNAVAVGGNVAVIVGSITVNNVTENGIYSTNDGLTFQQFPTNPGGGTQYGQDTVAVSANGSTIIWSQSGLAPYYSTNDGASWTASTGGMPSNGQIVADAVNPGDFYYHVGTDLYFSNNGGVSFTLETVSAPSGGQLAVNPFTSGDLWIAASGGLYHSSNFGATFTRISSALSSTNSVLALGALAPGKTNPAIYVFGTAGGFLGIYRSDDAGSTWTLLNDTNHQWGGLIQTLAADPNDYGRIYIGINGRGIIMGTPAAALPTGWSDNDLGSPGNPGWATYGSVTSLGGSANQWTIVGGGAGLAQDQFNFASQSVTGDALITAQLTNLTNADGTAGVPQAGIMFRATADSGSPFAAIVQSTTNQLIFEYRSTQGGAISSVTLSSISVGSKRIELTRSGNTFTAYTSADGNTWTQLGSPITISSMPATASAGLVASAGYNPQLTSATFENVAVTSISAEQLNSSNQIVYTFSGNASDALAQSSVSLTPLIGGAPVSPTGFSYNSTTNTATFTLPASMTSGIYEASLLNSTFDFVGVYNSDDFALPGSDQTYAVQQFFISPTATLDLGSNTLEVQYTAGNSPAAALANAIATAYAHGTWSGVGITSSLAATDSSATTGVGYFDDGIEVKLRRTWYGDTNLDGVINADDLSLISGGVAAGGTRWQDGNFNYNAPVNADDWAKLIYVIAYSRGQYIATFSSATLPANSISAMLASADPVGL